MVSAFILFAFTITASISVTSAYHPLIYAGLYEKDFYQEFKNYYRNGKVMTQALSDLLEVPQRPRLNIEDIPRTLKPKYCLACRALTYSTINFYKETNSTEEFGDFLIDICIKLVGIQDYICRGDIKVYLTTIQYILKERQYTLTSDDVCGVYLQYIKCNSNDYVIDFTVELSPNDKEANKSKEYDFKDDDANFQILHLSDFHYDPYYQEGSIADCSEYICCRSTSLPTNKTAHKAGRWGDYFPCDSPGVLTENICSQIATNHKNIDVIYYTGDFVDHFEYNTTKEHIKYSIEFITNEFKNTFGDIPVIMMLGNHDAHPSNAFAPSSVTDDSINTKWLYDFVADQWSRWLPESALETLRKEGYYTLILRPGLRVIVLHNNLCYVSNIWLHYKPNYMKDQLEWLRDTLKAAETGGEKVHILGHVPPNNYASAYVWNREYRRVVLRYAHIISGQFNGHTHRDEFSIFYSEHDVAVNVAWNGGSGTTYAALNSNYRIYHANSKNFEVIDHETWIFNLTEANQNYNKTPVWFKEYSFKETYGVTDLSPASLHDLFFNRWLNNRAEFKKYLDFSMKLSDVALAAGCDNKCEHRAFCTISMCPP